MWNMKGSQRRLRGCVPFRVRLYERYLDRTMWLLSWRQAPRRILPESCATASTPFKGLPTLKHVCGMLKMLLVLGKGVLRVGEAGLIEGNCSTGSTLHQAGVLSIG